MLPKLGLTIKALVPAPVVPTFFSRTSQIFFLLFNFAHFSLLDLLIVSRSCKDSIFRIPTCCDSLCLTAPARIRLKEVWIFVSGVAIFRSGCVEGGVRNSGLLLIYGREGAGERGEGSDGGCGWS
ncbi:hypothetical protein VNO80_22464 [Phaseolus coccineus]|uniref:Uncharacterized protein n=1 Tax=Phaseolus coccineus TaxID=3886 RepID=A0AAN9M5R2_PHACN